jgi:hypothetical protein
MTDRALIQQALDALKIADELCDGHGVDFKEYGLKVDKDIQRKYKKTITALRDRLAHCDRCGKKMGGEGDIHTCTPPRLNLDPTPISGWGQQSIGMGIPSQPEQEPDPIGDAQDRLIAELAAQPKQEPVAYTTGHCKEKAQPGGCQLHNLHCGYPACDRKTVTTPPAAPVQEPVAWMYQCTADNSGPVLLQQKQNWAESGTGLWVESPLCTTPPAAAQRQLVGLTKYERAECWYGKNCLEQSPPFDGYAEAIEAKLKEKNT